MYCQKCGKTIPDDSQFCPFCGDVPYGEVKKTKVRTSEVVVYVDEVDEEIARRKKLIPLYIGLIILGVFSASFATIRALSLIISSGNRFLFQMIHIFVTAPSSLVALAGVLGIVLSGNRKLAKKALQKRKKKAGEQHEKST